MIARCHLNLTEIYTPSSLSPLTRSCTVRGANREEYVLPSHYHPISPMFTHLDYLLTITAGSLKI